MKKKILSLKNILVVGDSHGRGNWEKAIHESIRALDEIIFVGDYLDSFTISAEDQIRNLENLVSIAVAEPKITLLLGNHDYAYIHRFSSISGYQPAFASAYRQILESNRDLFKIAWGHTSEDGDYTLITHAGLTYEYWNNTILPDMESGFLSQFDGVKDLPIHEILNLLIDKKDILWAVGHRRGGFRHPSPLWTDLYELLVDPYPEINQIFGHTAMKSQMISNQGGKFLLNVDNNQTGLTYVNLEK